MVQNILSSKLFKSKRGVLVTAGGIWFFIFLAFFVFGRWKLLTNDNADVQAIKSEVIDASKDDVLSAGIFFKMFDYFLHRLNCDYQRIAYAKC